VAQWTTGGGGETVPSVGGQTTHNGAGAPLSNSDDGWYYCDPQGQIQGEVAQHV